MSRRHRNRGEHIDVFVVFSDISLSLAFVILLYAFYTGLSATKTVVEATRTLRQQKVLEEILHSWQTRAKIIISTSELRSSQLSFARKGGSRDVDFSKTKSPYWFIYLTDSRSEVPLARIRLNASYLRVSVYASQFSGSEENMDDGLAKKLLIDSARVAAQHYGNDLDYLEVHGLSNDSSRSMQVSQARALAFAERLGDEKLISRGKDAAGQIPLRFLECYGTGSLLYPDENANRVDLRLFFTDQDKVTS